MKADVYDKILKEHFDCSDRETRQIMVTINEADQNQMLTALTSKLYDHIVNKVDDIDFGTIPESKGDITKVENFDAMCDCLDVIRNYLLEAKQKTDTVDEIETAIQNIVERKDVFEKGFTYNAEFVIVTYCTMVMAIIYSTSFLISSSIEFIKEPNADDFEVVVDNVGLKKTSNNMIFNNLKKFNESCKKKEFDKAMDYILSNVSKNFVGSMSVATGVVAGAVLSGIVLNIVPIIRESIFFFYHSRVTITDYFETQADLLQMNAYNVQNNSTINAKQKKDIYNKQMKVVTTFRKVANFFAISDKQAEIKATKEISDSKKKYKANELVESKPDSAVTSTSSSLF